MVCWLTIYWFIGLLGNASTYVSCSEKVGIIYFAITVSIGDNTPDFEIEVTLFWERHMYCLTF